jgi:hypothetical protein
MSDEKPLWTAEGFEEFRRSQQQTAKQRAENARSYTTIPGSSGLLHTQTQAPIVNFNAAPNQLEINTDNAAIVLGTDRPSGLSTGYGAPGAQGANAIDMVVGRMSSADGGKGPGDGVVVEPSFGADAARIYISQMTDIDTNFGLAAGNIGTINGHSGIGIKADGVRIIGREGVKIVTGNSSAFRGFGKDGETNSVGGRLPPAPPIELIAGNNTDDTTATSIQGQEETIKGLQPVNKGMNTRDALKELGMIVEEVIGSLFNMALLQTTFNSVLGVTPIYAHSVAAGMVSPQYLSKVINPLWQTRINKIMWKINYLEPYGYKYICSKNVFTT